jgi:hypothetical protein
MVQRCTNPHSEHFHNYGGRGIQVCARWFDAALFHTDMGDPPTPQYQIERRDNDAGYTPENCYWATPAQQSRNTRRTHLITFRGVTLCALDWCRVFGKRGGQQLAVCRLHQRGTTIEATLTRWLAGRDLQQLITAAGVTPKENSNV